MKKSTWGTWRIGIALHYTLIKLFMISGLDIRVTCSVQHPLALGWERCNVSRVP